MEPKAYKSGDIVWVLASKRLGWWPARVENVDLLRSDLKKDVTEKTIAVVKYFNEENYQFVEDAAIICAYNSSCKEENISLGMKKYYEKKRINEASSAFMKFPNDIKQAEVLTNGNPKIVENEKYQPKKPVPAQAKYKDIFVDPRAKETTKTKTPAKNTPSPRKPGRPPKDSSLSATSVSKPHSAGNPDHEVRIRKQENVSSPASSGTNGYKCDSCEFQTNRLNLMVIHQKMHISSPASQQQAPQKAGQKRTISSPKKVANKRTRKAPEEEGDLFDQVKRTLEAKESGNSKPSPQPKKTNKASATPKTPRTPRTAKTSPSTTSTSAKNSAVKASESKTQFNPKKKWLKSLQKEANPEVKIKLMADWDEEEDEAEKLKAAEEAKPEPPKPVVTEESTHMDTDSDQEPVPVKSGLLHRRSDDEDDDSNMETETETKTATSLETVQVDENASPEKSESIESTEEPFAGITAEIDRLNADLSAKKEEESSRSIEEKPVKQEATSPEKPKKENAKSDEEIRLELASLLAETSVPVLPDISKIAKPVHDDAIENETARQEENSEGVQAEERTEVEAPSEVMAENGIEGEVVEQSEGISEQADSATNQVEDAVTEQVEEVANQVEDVITEQVVEVAQQVEGVVAHQIAMVDGEMAAVVTNGVEEVTANGNGNILMQVEDGETYMVVWEPGSNIQELLACSAEGEDGTPGATQTLLIDPSSLQAGSELENLFQMAVAASAAPTPPNEQSNPT